MTIGMLFRTTIATAVFSLVTVSDAADKYIYNSTTDFPTLGNKEVEYYRDTKHRALAINAANPRYRNKWAHAETIFAGESGDYDITIMTLTERDGESSYRLLINGVEVGTFINPESKRSYQPASHTWPKVRVPRGASVAIESIAHTNGKIQARVGTAWSRGRWRSLTFNRSK